MRLFLLMLIVTAIEVILISKVGAAIGFFPTFLIIVITAFFGSMMLKRQWRSVIGRKLQSQPSEAMIEGLVLLVIGVLLVTPGFLTDIVGFIGLVPSIRERFIALLTRHGAGLFKGSVKMQSSSFGHHDTHSAHQDARRGSDSVIEGEFERKED